MKVNFTAEFTMDIPGEFQNDALAVQTITNELKELLGVGCEYEKYDQPDLMFTSVNIIQYTPKAGKL